MNDRFKFRTYLPDLKFFKYWGWQEENHYIGLCACGDTSMPELLEKYTTQCTGLKDNKGKLIYEGDVVRFKDCNDILVVNYQKEMACFAPQFYCNGEYGGRLWFDDYDSSECQFYKSNNFEIIGNVYENKEILESEKQTNEK